MPDPQVERLRRLSRRANETWQGGWVRLPSWINEGGGAPYRAWAPLWISVDRDLVGHVEPHHPAEKDYATALTALVQFACDAGRTGYRPGRLEVNDPALAEHLSGMLAEVGVEVVYRDRLPAVERCLAEMAEYMAGRPLLPGPLDGEGVTAERMHQFAEAAEAFHHAAPWEELSDEDLIEIESPQVPRGLEFACVLGAAGHTYGIGFFASRDDYWRLHGSSSDPGAYYAGSSSGAWSLQFGGVTELPLRDAGLWKDQDPRFAAEMQWMHRQHGSRKTPGIGGFFPTLAGYRGLLRDETIAPRPPAYTSELFRRTGVVLRNAYPSDRQTYLHMITGQNHDHYDRDSGSIVLYGKGRALANDFGYYGHVTGEDHNRVVSSAAPGSAVMHVKDSVPAGTVDYVRGVKREWRRQILFVKDANALGANYFVLRESLRPPADGTWRLYCTADKVAAGGPHVRVTGKEDVDLDIFFACPARPDVRTHTISRSSWGLSSEVRYGRVTTTQTGVVVAMPSGQDVLTVLYPRLKCDGPPVVTALAGGKGVKVHTDSRTDYVFLSREPLKFSEAGIAFEGTAGAAAIRGKTVTLTLSAAGVLSAAGKTLRAGGPATKQWPQ